MSEIFEEADNKKYFVVSRKALPEILLKVVEAKRLLESGRVQTVQEAIERAGISRSSFYKYQDDVFPYHNNTRGRAFTVVMQMDDRTGLLAEVMQVIADFHANVLTIHQSIPVNGIASVTLSADVLPATGDVNQMVEEIEQLQGIHYVKIIAKEG
ncbi:MAG: ACT domain-containing protein [Lachnospiraceae bacterium]|nr:ACT domain-containing protein [Lachnospiraceae bacterium]